MAYGDYDGPDKEDKGKEGGSCNRTRCQCAPAVWYNHGSFSWYCVECKDAIWEANKYTFHRDMPSVKHPMFETREMITAREQAVVEERLRPENIDRPFDSPDQLRNFINGLL